MSTPPNLTMEADARRLAACWNACMGISTEELEIISDAGETFVTVRDRYVAQRDELLYVLWVCMEHDRLYFGDNHNTVIQAQAAISKATK